MDTLIIYLSFYGNTGTIAERIEKTLGKKAELRFFEDVKEKEIRSASLLIFGSPTHKYYSPSHMREFLDMGDFILNGRADCWARTEDNRLWRVEHKTTARMDSHYLNGLKGGLQGAIYDFLGEKLFHEDLSGTIYNLLIKTKIPDYKRAYSRINRKAIERMLETIEGVHRDIQRGDFYPSSSCFNFNSECSFKILCERDTPENRNAFFTKREEVSQSTESEEDANSDV